MKAERREIWIGRILPRSQCRVYLFAVAHSIWLDGQKKVSKVVSALPPARLHGRPRVSVGAVPASAGACTATANDDGSDGGSHSGGSHNGGSDSDSSDYDGSDDDGSRQPPHPPIALADAPRRPPTRVMRVTPQSEITVLLPPAPDHEMLP
ncbi:hypothetical protein PHLGIDRAFT_122625 [Phlebiopsis gigantea 11061_1 CR5-6]|uniref:Uncharacterized protein n=1 Tax=Phlebiopsis gigantea (strain 11061_1 CR5-6) TaxID=745531 RepID=A0A0C3S370_PHLG1|nr:hypothetical protein PHLGIDRAFT_122625 [Phlebiopsis gigantea 11061_1 CR5-6]